MVSGTPAEPRRSKSKQLPLTGTQMDRLVTK
jgi:hypothetical protein